MTLASKFVSGRGIQSGGSSDYPTTRTRNLSTFIVALLATPNTTARQAQHTNRIVQCAALAHPVLCYWLKSHRVICLFRSKGPPGYSSPSMTNDTPAVKNFLHPSRWLLRTSFPLTCSTSPSPNTSIPRHCRKLLYRNLVLQEHVVLRRKSDAGTHDVDQAPALREESVHNGRARRHQGGFDEKRKDR